MDAARTALQSRGKIPPRARSRGRAVPLPAPSMTARLYRYRTSPCNNAMPILRKPAALRRGGRAIRRNRRGGESGKARPGDRSLSVHGRRDAYSMDGGCVEYTG